MDKISNSKGEKEMSKKSKSKIVRSNGSGVWFGEIKSEEGDTVVLKNAIRLWQWSGAASLSELAMTGTKRPGNCKFCVVVDEVKVFNVLEILSVTIEAEESIKGVTPWTA